MAHPDIARYDEVLNSLPAPTGQPIDLPRVRYFHLGQNEWRTAGDWPIPEAQETAFFLGSGGSANSRSGDGTLGLEVPSDAAASDCFVYDPADPVPSLGGGATGAGVLKGARDQQEIELRRDVLWYTGDTLEAPLDISGPVAAVLHVSSTALDTPTSPPSSWTSTPTDARSTYARGFCGCAIATAIRDRD